MKSDKYTPAMDGFDFIPQEPPYPDRISALKEQIRLLCQENDLLRQNRLKFMETVDEYIKYIEDFGLQRPGGFMPGIVLDDARRLRTENEELKKLVGR